MHKLLVSGYLQAVENTLESDLIIPSTIHHIIYQYYFTVERSKLLYLNTDYRHTHGLYIANIQNENKWKCNLYELEVKQNDICKIIDFGKREDITKWNITNAGATYTEHFILPKHFISAHWGHHNDDEVFHQYNIIFKCGGHASAQCCWAIIMNEIQFKNNYNKTNKINGYLWTLPSFPLEITNNFLIYSDQYGLISVGGLEGYGFSDNMYKLSFSNTAYREGNMNKWKWKRINSKLNDRRSLTTSIMIKSQNNYQINEKLVIIGGYHYKSLSSVEIYDFAIEQNEYGTKCAQLSSLNVARRKCGACYNSMYQRIYVCGGHGNNIKTGHHFEWYDIVKNKWFELKKNTTNRHQNYPVVWIDNNKNNYDVIINQSKNVLCIASINGIEYFDLREDKTFATLKCNNKKQRYDLTQLFCIDNADKSHCKLLRQILCLYSAA
eukprot:93486_1